ncbi:MAG: DUF503 domain-containing protein [Bryobacteraceae bacterium]
MPAIGVLTIELRIEHAHSLKDKRHVVRGLRDRLRHKHNISIAEIGYQDLWQSALLAAVTVSSSRQFAGQVLHAVERDVARDVGEMLVNTFVEWIE